MIAVATAIATCAESRQANQLSIAANEFARVGNSVAERAIVLAEEANSISRSSQVTATQANDLAREANAAAKTANSIAAQEASSNPVIIWHASTHATVVITGCEREQGDFKLGRYVADAFIMANQGGRDVSLIGIVARQGDRTYQTRLHEGGRIIGVPLHTDEIPLPQDIDSGLARQWLVQASDVRYYPSWNEALHDRTIFEEESELVTWEFRFSDGNTIQVDSTVASTSNNPNMGPGFKCPSQ